MFHVALKKTRARSQRRSSQTGFQKPREKFYACAEGKTEQAYIRALLDYRHPRSFTPEFIKSKSSLSNLIDDARRAAKHAAKNSCIWIICDVDENETHKDKLELWLSESPTLHRIAMQSPAIEGWFLQHCDKPSRPSTSQAALDQLIAQWPEYVKGKEIPKWLIQNTDIAKKRETDYLRGRVSNEPFPAPGSSQMPDLIDYLDELSSKRNSS